MNNTTTSSSSTTATSSTSLAPNNTLNNENPIVFMDVAIVNQQNPVHLGRIKIELFADIVPKTAENFRQFCTGEHRVAGLPIGYKDCTFHKISKDFMIQGGDFVKRDGSGRTSIYGERFADENFKIKHSGPGLLSMVNSGPNSNGCQFFITCVAAEWLDGKNVVFGKVIDGLKVVRTIEDIPVNPTTNRPKYDVVITECGQL
ncbi:hypothetical protein ACTFIT_003379 [Dictyostelium discoideum]